MDDVISILSKIKAHRDLIFQACSHRDLLHVWFFPGGWSNSSNYDLSFLKDESLSDLTEGVRDPCDSEGRLKDDEEYVFALEVLEILSPQKIVFKYSSALVQNSIISIELFEVDQYTEVFVTHSGLHEQHFRDVHLRAWQENLELLSRLVQKSLLH
jgi:uncharacterized protein YndB with AHSA1/START domain